VLETPDDNKLLGMPKFQFSLVILLHVHCWMGGSVGGLTAGVKTEMRGLVDQVDLCPGDLFDRPLLSDPAVARLLDDRRTLLGRSIGRLEAFGALNAHELDDRVFGPGWRRSHQTGRGCYPRSEQQPDKSVISHCKFPSW
jgi:hypothetical protein